MEGPVVRTSRGALRGAATEGGYLFGGLPFAASPDGPLRYRAPQPANAWDGVREATAAAGSMPQPERVLPGLRSGPLLGRWDGEAPELCVNVWTPDPAAKGLPVLVWFHGGAFVGGSPGLPVYDGRAWMRDGVVLVTASYRLGVEGFVWLQGGEPNVALRDQLAALRWVQEEIAAFGGDPRRVCAAGQSAGAMTLGLLLGSPEARGLFARAISMSGGLDLTLSPEQAARVAQAVATRAGAEPTAEAMREVPLERVIAAQASIAPGEIDLGTAEHRDPGGGLIWLMPVRDGELVSDDPLGALGRAGEVALLAGDTAEEGRLYLAGVPGFDAFPEDALAAFAANLVADPVERIAACRARLGEASPGDVAAALITETAFSVPTGALLERHRALAGASTHAYRFTWRSSALGGRLGAAHAVDLPFAFDFLDAPGIAGADDALLGIDGGPAELASRMHRAWVRFVTDGDPGWPAHPHVETIG